MLVASTDPVGTKLKLAVMTGCFEGIGEDLVNACVNDVIVCGAKPILFLDYINMSSLRPDVVTTLVRYIYGLDSDLTPLEEFRTELDETLGDALLRPHPPYYNGLINSPR